MKVQCGQCPAKYAVADERVRDKKVRIHCKRCNSAIVVDGKVDPPLVTTTPARPSAGPARPSSSPAPEAPPEPKPASPRPVAHTIMGGLEAPAAERLAEARANLQPKASGGRRLTPPSSPALALGNERGKPNADRGFTDPPEADDQRWRVALTQHDLRWMTTEEIGEAYRAGAVQLETFVFRAGMPTWVTLLEVPELAVALGHSFVEAPALGGLAQAAAAAEAQAARGKAPGSKPDAALKPMADAEDPQPFALVPGRANGARKVEREATARAEGSSPVAATAPVPGSSPANPNPNTIPTPLAPPLAGADLPPIPPPAPMPAMAQLEGKTSPWIWVVIAIAVLAAVVVFFGPRFGLRLR